MLQLTQRGRTLPGEITATDAKEARQKIRQKGINPCFKLSQNLGAGRRTDKKGEDKRKRSSSKKKRFQGNEKEEFVEKGRRLV